MKSTTALWTFLFVAGLLALVARGVVTGAGSRYVRAVEVKSAAGEVQWTRYESVPPKSLGEPGVSVSRPRTLGLWISALLTLATFSLLYGDNVWFKLAQSLVVGVAAGFAVVTGFWTMIVPNLFAKLAPDAARNTFVPGLEPGTSSDWWSLIPLLLCAMMLWRLSPRGGWISRWPLAFFIGLTAGLQLVSIFKADFVDQISGTMLPLIVMKDSGIDCWKSIRNVLIVGSVLSVLVYFLFSVEHKGLVGRVARLGIGVLMITFGASFGMTVMGRISLLAARLQFLFDDWLWMIDPLGTRTVL